MIYYLSYYLRYIVSSINLSIPLPTRCLPGDRRYPPGGGVLPGSGPLQHSAQDSTGWHPPVRDQAALPGGGAAPLQRAHVSAHLRNEPAQTPAEAARYSTRTSEYVGAQLRDPRYRGSYSL